MARSDDLLNTIRELVKEFEARPIPKLCSLLSKLGIKSAADSTCDNLKAQFDMLDATLKSFHDQRPGPK